MIKKRYILALLLSLLLITSCGNKADEKTSEKVQNEENIPVNTEQEIEIPSEDDIKLKQETITEEEISAEIKPAGFINPLTGIEEETDKTNIRPIAVMINNLHEALPQIGISEADIMYETLEEGGITRLLCIYNDYSDIPEIGSVRSARDYYIDIADAHDAIFVHAGGSTYAYTALAERKTNNIDGIYHGEFYRSAERRKTMSKEHTLMISGEGLDHAIAYRGYRTSSTSPSPLTFSADYTKGEETAEHIEFPFSIGYTSRPYVTAFFDYNKETSEYLKGEFGKAHIDGDDNSTLSFKNVLTLSCPMNIIKGDPLGCIQVHFTGTGTGTYAVDGTHRSIVWKKQSRSSAYTLYESDGVTPLMLAPGKSYIGVISSGTQITIN